MLCVGKLRSRVNFSLRIVTGALSLATVGVFVVVPLDPKYGLVLGLCVGFTGGLSVLTDFSMVLSGMGSALPGIVVVPLVGLAAGTSFVIRTLPCCPASELVVV